MNSNAKFCSFDSMRSVILLFLYVKFYYLFAYFIILNNILRLIDFLDLFNLSMKTWSFWTKSLTSVFWYMSPKRELPYNLSY